ncbi:hypothetical protein Nepgr_019065 [Nepenthes gracilis]|uniref:Uncharacterized protein n=1 Tax=Nepenthes gracilis TaxID=150966 RepID=A0AAD3SV28_NEPGR|nr:hypothetical protein Nepgr_019065 [Nepenthes gracilis]
MGNAETACMEQDSFCVLNFEALLVSVLAVRLIGEREQKSKDIKYQDPAGRLKSQKTFAPCTQFVTIDLICIASVLDQLESQDRQLLLDVKLLGYLSSPCP